MVYFPRANKPTLELLVQIFISIRDTMATYILISWSFVCGGRKLDCERSVNAFNYVVKIKYVIWIMYGYMQKSFMARMEYYPKILCKATE